MGKIAAMAVCLCFLAGSMSGKPNKASAADQKNPQAQPPSTIINIENSEEPSAHSNQPNSNPPKWYTPIKRALAQPDWWLVIIAFLTGCAIAYQAREMALATEEMRKSTVEAKKSADAAEDNARAALLNAKAIINSERAWIDVNFALQGGIRYDFIVTNVGKSPAFITQRVLGRGYWNEEVKEIPVGYEGGDSAERVNMYNILPVSPEPTNLTTFDVAHYPKGEGQTVTYHGHVSYKDIFGQEHRTEVVYSFQKSTLRLKNLPQYTRYVTKTKDGEEIN